MRKGVMQTSEPASTQEGTERMANIIDSTYSKAYLKQVSNSATHLNAEERILLLILLKYFEDFFNGNLGYWSTEPIDLNLRPGSKPFNSRYYSIPRIKKEIFQKDLKHLVKIGVLPPVQQRQCGTPIFTIHKKEGNVGFITDYHRLNHKLVRKPYPLPRIGETIQQLQGFRYAEALDLNMRYYIIRLSFASQDMTKTVTEFGEFRYNPLPMCMCSPGDIFHAKVDELLGDIKGVKRVLMIYSS